MSINTKGKGTKSERELIHMFWEKGCPCIRVAGSGSNRYPSPDLILGTANGKLGIEVKSTSKDKVYISNQQVEDLKYFCSAFGAEPWIAARFDKKGWFFFRPNNLVSTDNSYIVQISNEKNEEFWKLIGNL